MKPIKDIDIINKKYNKLTVISYVYKKNKHKFFLCKCDCGKDTIVSLSDIRNNHTKSCGCAKGKHKLSRTRIYRIYLGIISRCYTKTCNTYYKYGAKGITVCDDWKNDFLAFYKWSMDNGYAENLTIDRINPKLNYSPENCRWASYLQQNTNLSMLKTNKSGYKGVSWSKDCNKWLCVISINNKSKRIGAYKTQKEAVEARNNFIDNNNLPHQKNEYIGELSNGY